MPVLEEIDITLDAREVVLELHRGKRAPEALVDETTAVIEQSRKLFRPRAVYEWVGVQGVKGETVFLDSGETGSAVSLNMGPHSDLMEEAEMAMVSAVTIGAAINDRIAELHRDRRLLDAYLLDSVGVVALGEVGKVVRRLAEKEAESRGWGVSGSLAPGSLQGWPVEGQDELCALIPIDRIHVHLNESGVLIPFKSASSLIGTGPGYPSKKVGSVCRYCSLAKTCWRRRK
ncbi:MAG: hypothetical protein WAL98_11125 [Desulfatiglandaceae bacterium]